MSGFFPDLGTRNDEWNALKILNPDGVTSDFVSEGNPLPITSVAAAASPTDNFNAWDISSTNPLPVSGQ